jgi:glyoxylase-like metal-dependent hydrolase (beta-lactamase superfamily II)
LKIYPIETGRIKLDGGAMFGVVPKTIWQRTNPADAHNRIEVSMRSLLIEDGERLLLIDTGIGNKQSESFFGHFDVSRDFSLERSLANYGFHKDDITDVFLTHLHFDHCGGCIEWNATKTFFQPAFKNARFWSNKEHWKWATEPNSREKASFLSENILPIQESGQLNFVEVNDENYLKNTALGFEILTVDGHTEKQMLPHIRYKGKTIVFVADLLPTIGHIPLPYVMSYDTRPLLTMQEKELFLREAVAQEYLLFLEHDASNELCTIKQTDKGFRLKETFSFKDQFTI